MKMVFSSFELHFTSNSKTFQKRSFLQNIYMLILKQTYVKIFFINETWKMISYFL